jgi:hypothetical protein
MSEAVGKFIGYSKTAAFAPPRCAAERGLGGEEHLPFSCLLIVTYDPSPGSLFTIATVSTLTRVTRSTRLTM